MLWGTADGNRQEWSIIVVEQLVRAYPALEGSTICTLLPAFQQLQVEPVYVATRLAGHSQFDAGHGIVSYHIAVFLLNGGRAKYGPICPCVNPHHKPNCDHPCLSLKVITVPND